MSGNCLAVLILELFPFIYHQILAAGFEQCSEGQGEVGQICLRSIGGIQTQNGK